MGKKTTIILAILLGISILTTIIFALNLEDCDADRSGYKKAYLECQGDVSVIDYPSSVSNQQTENNVID
jgi:hypothetical protein